MMSQNGSIDGKDLALVSDGSGRPDPEVPERLERARRRQFTVGYKLRILSEADASRTTGEIGALLRRGGLYSSHPAAWRRQREEGGLKAPSPPRRGRPTSPPPQRERGRRGPGEEGPWRRQREEGILNALSPRRRGRPTSSPEQRELARLRQENERLGQRLAAAEAVIDVQKKWRCCSGWSSRAGRATSAPDGERDRVGA